MDNKYELTDNTQEVDGHTLHRIKALKSFGDVKKGDLGGWVESYDNLSQKGNSWVYDKAKVYDDAEVFDNAKVYDHAKIYDQAQVYDDACIFDSAKIFDSVNVFAQSRVLGNAEIGGVIWVDGSAVIS